MLSFKYRLRFLLSQTRKGAEEYFSLVGVSFRELLEKGILKDSLGLYLDQVFLQYKAFIF